MSNPNQDHFPTYTCGHARFTVLSQGLIRMEWCEAKTFEDRPTLKTIRTAGRKTEVQIGHHDDKGIELDTGRIHLSYTDTGKAFNRQNLKATLRINGKDTAWHFGKKNPGIIGGLARSLDNCEGESRATWDNKADGTVAIRKIGRQVETDDGLISRAGWCVVDDSDGIPLGESAKGSTWLGEPLPGRHMDQYLFAYGQDYKQAIRDAMLVFGRQPLLPRYAFGYWYSRFWTYTEEEILELSETFNALQLPLDVLVVDMDWHKLGWTGYSWDGQLFPYPEKCLSALADKGIRISLNLHPADGVHPHEDEFPAFCQRMGKDPAKTKHIPFAPTDPTFMQAYFELLHHPQEARGVDFWWMDWQQGKQTDVENLDPLDWLTFTHWQDQLTQAPRRRPINFTRYAGLGSGRMPMAFMGDTYSTWEGLQDEPHYIARGANCLYGYLSPDIGGHLCVDTSPELFVRWMQMGVHCPITRTHASKNPDSERRIWQYADPYRSLLTQALKRRYELIPYLYTEARKMYDSGLAFHRPLYFDYPDHPEAYRDTGIYCLGDAMLVRPITAPVDPATGLATVRFWLPPGEWIDCARGLTLAGDRWHTARYLLAEVPTFVRPGTIIPGQQDVTRTQNGSAPNLTITVWPGKTGSYTLYEDDGLTRDYEDETAARIKITCKQTKRLLTLTIAPHEGSFPGFQDHRLIRITLPMQLPPKKVDTDAPAHCSYRGSDMSAVIDLGLQDLTQKQTIRIHLNTKDTLPEGAKGIFERMRAISLEARALSLWKPVHAEERLPAEVGLIPYRMECEPEKAGELCRSLHSRIQESLAALEKTKRSYQRSAKKNNSDYFREMATAMAKPVKLCRSILKDFF